MKLWKCLKGALRKEVRCRTKKIRKCWYCGKQLSEDNEVDYCYWGHSREAVTYYKRMAAQIKREWDERDAKNQIGAYI